MAVSIIIIFFLLVTIALQARRIRSFYGAVEDLQTILRSRLSHARFNYNGFASDDAMIQELEEIIEATDDIFDEV
jgi:hypothetical protein